MSASEPIADLFADLEERVEGLTVSALACDVDTDEVLFAHGADTVLDTASVGKIFLLHRLLTEVDAGTRSLEDRVTRRPVHSVACGPHAAASTRRMDLPGRQTRGNSARRICTGCSSLPRVTSAMVNVRGPPSRSTASSWSDLGASVSVMSNDMAQITIPSK